MIKNLSIFMPFILLIGCATQAELDARTIEDIDITGKDKNCVRQALSDYSSCAGGAANSSSSGAVISGLAACKSAYKVVVTTCPAAR